jgi:hypothetical protein
VTIKHSYTLNSGQRDGTRHTKVVNFTFLEEVESQMVGRVNHCSTKRKGKVEVQHCRYRPNWPRGWIEV